VKSRGYIATQLTMCCRHCARTAAAAALLICVCCINTAAHCETLQEVLLRFYKDGATLKSARETAAAADESVPQARSAERPTIEVDARDGYSQDRVQTAEPFPVPSSSFQYPSRSYSLIVTQPLYRGGRTNAEIQAATYRARSGQANLRATEEASLIKVIQDYLDVAEAQSDLSTYQQETDYYADQLRKAEQRLKIGEADRSDLELAQAAYLKAQATAGQASGRLDVARVELYKDAGFAVESASLDLSLPDYPDDRLADEDLALKNDASVAQTWAEAERARYNVKDARGALLPTVSLQGVLQRDEVHDGSDRVESVKSVAVQLRVPLYDGGLAASQIRQAKATYQARLADEQQARLAALADADSAYAQWLSSMRTLTAFKAATEAYGRARETVEKQKDLGEKSELDVLIARQNESESTIAYIGAKKSNVLAYFERSYARGTLLKDTVGSSNVFDPTVYYKQVNRKLF